jgi:hypothetical protein
MSRKNEFRKRDAVVLVLYQDKVCPRTGYEGLEGSRGTVLLYSFFNLGAGLGVGGWRHSPAALPLGKRPGAQLYRRWSPGPVLRGGENLGPITIFCTLLHSVLHPYLFLYPNVLHFAFCVLLTTRNTNIHAPGGIRTRNPSRRSAANRRLRPLGHWVGFDPRTL